MQKILPKQLIILEVLLQRAPQTVHRHDFVKIDRLTDCQQTVNYSTGAGNGEAVRIVFRAAL